MRNWLLKRIFGILFSGYNFPFDKLDEKLYTMNDGARRDYFYKALELKNNPVFQDILHEGIRKMYQKLSVNSANSVEQASYRATLVWIQEHFIKTVNNLSIPVENVEAKLKTYAKKSKQKTTRYGRNEAK